MNVSLTPELEIFVDEKVRSGDYASASEVVTAALWLLLLLEDADKLQHVRRSRVRREVMKGVAEIKAGSGKTYRSAKEAAEAVVARAKIRAGK